MWIMLNGSWRNLQTYPESDRSTTCLRVGRYPWHENVCPFLSKSNAADFSQTNPLFWPHMSTRCISKIFQSCLKWSFSNFRYRFLRWGSGDVFFWWLFYKDLICTEKNICPTLKQEVDASHFVLFMLVLQPVAQGTFHGKKKNGLYWIATYSGSNLNSHLLSSFENANEKPVIGKSCRLLDVFPLLFASLFTFKQILTQDSWSSHLKCKWHRQLYQIIHKNPPKNVAYWMWRLCLYCFAYHCCCSLVWPLTWFHYCSRNTVSSTGLSGKNLRAWNSTHISLWALSDHKHFKPALK